MSHVAVRPRALCHRGVVDAHGYLLSAELLGERGQLESALELYAGGARVLQLDGASWLVCLPRPVRVHSAACHGAPLTRLESGHLAAAPLTAAEQAGVADGCGLSVLWLRRGELMQTPLARCTEVDLAARIELPALQVIELQALTDPPRPIEVDAPPAARPLRSILADRVPPPSEAQQAMLQSLSSQRDAKPAGASAIRTAAANAVSAAAGVARSWLQRLRRVLANASRGTAAASARAPQQAAAPRSALPVAPSLLSKLWSALERRLRLMTLRSPLGSLLSIRQTRYLQKMLSLFEDRDLSEALRHAIPLAPPGRPGEPGQPALGVPEPRADLSLHSQYRSGGGSAFSSDTLYAHLQKVYRAAAERLVREGKLHEAAFVYAELLHDVAAAIAMLERAHAYAEAAELAEGRQQPAGLVVRLWFLAKRVDRAVAYAAAHDAFADAIRRLVAHDVNAAHALRLTWAQRLAAAGQYSKAVDVLWPFEGARHIAQAWLEQVIALGGAPGARALARAIQLNRSEPRLLEAAYRGFLSDGGDGGYDAAHARMELASRLLEAGAEDNTRAGRYLPALLREVLNDAAQGWVIYERSLRRTFERLTADKALLADVPANVEASAAPHAPVSELAWQREDTGSLAITDAVRLGSGGYALALGENGVRMLNANGKTRAQLSLPTDQLIVSDNGLVAISLKHRDHLVRLGHVDFVRGSAEHWADTQLDAWARDHDGERWFVRRGEDLLCLDLLRTDLHAAWRAQDKDFAIATTLQRDAKHLLVASIHTPEVWRYELPSITLRQRVALNEPLNEDLVVVARAFDMAGGRYARLYALRRDDTHMDISLSALDRVFPLLEGIEDLHFALLGLIATTEHAVVVYRANDETIADVFALGSPARVFRLVVSERVKMSASVKDGRLLLADGRGRLLDYDLRKGQVVHDLRLFV